MRQEDCSTLWDSQQKMLDGLMWSVCNINILTLSSNYLRGGVACSVMRVRRTVAAVRYYSTNTTAAAAAAAARWCVDGRRLVRGNTQTDTQGERTRERERERDRELEASAHRLGGRIKARSHSRHRDRNETRKLPWIRDRGQTYGVTKNATDCSTLLTLTITATPSL